MSLKLTFIVLVYFFISIILTIFTMKGMEKFPKKDISKYYLSILILLIFSPILYLINFKKN